MKAKRMFSIVLALLMALSLLVGCQGNTGNASSADGAGNSDTQNGTSSMSAVPEGDPTTVTFGCSWQFATSPVMWTETTVWQEIQKRANVKIDYLFYDQDKYNLMLAGSNFPDFVFGNFTDTIQTIIDSKLALDLDPYLSTYTNLDLDFYQQRNQTMRTVFGGEEEALYFLSDCAGEELRNGGVESLRGCIVRWDWYKEIDAPAIDTYEDYAKALEAMVEKHPTTDDGKTVYATGVNGTVFTEWYFNGCFFKPALMQPYTMSGYLYMLGFEDSKMYNGYTNVERSPFWNDMKFYNTLWNKGLLDPDSFTMTQEQYNEKIASGQYAATMAWAASDLYSTEKENDPDTLADYLIIPSKATLVYGNYPQPNGYMPAYQIWVPKTAKNVEGALSLLNQLHDPEVNRIIMSGVEGEQWEYVDGVPTLKEEAIELSVAGSDEWAKVGTYRDSPLSFMQGSTVLEDGGLVDLFDSDAIRPSALDPVQKDYAEFYGVDYPSQACMALVESGDIIDLSEFKDCAPFLDPMTNDLERIASNCNNILLQAVPALVQAESEEEFNQVRDKALADMKAAGEETVWEWMQQNYEQAMATFEGK